MPEHKFLTSKPDPVGDQNWVAEQFRMANAKVVAEADTFWDRSVYFAGGFWVLAAVVDAFNRLNPNLLPSLVRLAMAVAVLYVWDKLMERLIAKRKTVLLEQFNAMELQALKNSVNIWDFSRIKWKTKQRACQLATLVFTWWVLVVRE